MSPCISKHVERQGHTTKKTMSMDLKSDIKKNTTHWSFMIAWKLWFRDLVGMEAFIYSQKKKKILLEFLLINLFLP